MKNLNNITDQRYKNSTLCLKIKTIKTLLRTVEIKDVRIKSKIEFYCTKIENQIYSYFFIFINNKNDIKTRINHLQGVFCFFIWLKSLLQKKLMKQIYHLKLKDKSKIRLKL